MNDIEKFKSESEALFRVQWLLENCYKVTIWWEGEEHAKIYCISSYSML